MQINFLWAACYSKSKMAASRVTGYASKAFSPAEIKYCTTRRSRRELAATIYGLKHYRHLLLGHHFVLRTDHAAITHLKRTHTPVGQAARYLDIIAEYNFTVCYRPGLRTEMRTRSAEGLAIAIRICRYAVCTPTSQGGGRSNGRRWG